MMNKVDKPMLYKLCRWCYGAGCMPLGNVAYAPWPADCVCCQSESVCEHMREGITTSHLSEMTGG